MHTLTAAPPVFEESNQRSPLASAGGATTVPGGELRGSTSPPGWYGDSAAREDCISVPANTHDMNTYMQARMYTQQR